MLKRGMYGFAAATCGYVAFSLGQAALRYPHPVLMVLTAGTGTGAVLLGREAMQRELSDSTETM